MSTTEEYVPLENEVTVYGDMEVPEAAVSEEEGDIGHSGIYLPSSSELIEQNKRYRRKPDTVNPSASLYVQGRQRKLKPLRTRAMAGASTIVEQKVVPQSTSMQEPEGVQFISGTPEGAIPLESDTLQIIEPNIVAKQIRQTEYNTIKKKNTDIASGDIEEILSQTEDGELVGVSVSVDSPNAIVEIAVFGDSDTYIELNTISVDDLVAEGNGLTAGDVALLPDATSPDRPGVNDGVSVYCARYKADSINSWVLNGQSTTRPCFVVKYMPQIPFPYKAVSISVRNNASSTVTMYAGRVLRILHTITEYEVHEPTQVSRINQTL